ncbi:hypothetical protein REPUB_Repub12eG0148300 [Reevesia pubescens]
MSAYGLQMEVVNPIDHWWKKVWSLNCNTKIKAFIWKALHEVLPCSTLLCQRKLVPSNVCFRCGVYEESILHALRDCVKYKEVWLQVDNDLMNSNFFTLSLTDWIVSKISSKRMVAGLPWAVPS